jgi:IS1 family transposase
MRENWYRAEIKGQGFYMESGSVLPETKVVHFEFQARNKMEAREKVEDRLSEIRREFWMTDSNPAITIMQIIAGNQPIQERIYLAN